EGESLLAVSTQDDAAERVALLLDRPDVLRNLSLRTLRAVGDSMLHHRRWQRAVDLYEIVRGGAPEARGELDFAMGRARFFAEQSEDAEGLYERAATNASRRYDRVRALYHAARAAQLRGRLAAAELLLGRAIAEPGRSDAAAA